MRDNNSNCCCLHVKTCATIVSVFGIIIALLSILSVIFLWFYIPLAILTILVYIFVLIGIRLERSEFLLPATVFLAINIVLNIFMFVAFIIVGSIAPVDLVSRYAVDTNGDFHEAETLIRISFFVCAVIILIVIIYSVFAFTIFLKARNYLIETVHPHPYSNESMEPPSYFISSTHFPQFSKA